MHYNLNTTCLLEVYITGAELWGPIIPEFNTILYSIILLHSVSYRSQRIFTTAYPSTDNSSVRLQY